MRNNVNGNGLINGGYTTNNPNVIQNHFFNPDVQSVQIPNGTFISSQPYFGSQQMSYPAMYNQIPNYYPLGVINYASPNTGLSNGQILMKSNSYSTQMCNLPSSLNVVDPNTLTQINLSNINATVLPKRKSALQIIDPNTKSEIDVAKFILEKKIQEGSLKESNHKANVEQFTFNFESEKDDKISDSILNETNNDTSLTVLPVVHETSENKETEIVTSEYKSEISMETLIEKNENIDVIHSEVKLEEKTHAYDDDDDMYLKNALYETKEDEDEFIEVVNKKKKKQQSKIVAQEKVKINETKLLKNNKKEMPFKSNNNKRDTDEKNYKSTQSKDTKSQRNIKSEITKFEKNDDVSNSKEVTNLSHKNNTNNQEENCLKEEKSKHVSTFENNDKEVENESSKYQRRNNTKFHGNRKQNLMQNEVNYNNRKQTESFDYNSRCNSISRKNYNNSSQSRDSSIRRNETRESINLRNDTRFNNNVYQQPEIRDESKSRGEKKLYNGHQNEFRDNSLKRYDNHSNGQTKDIKDNYRRVNNRYQNGNQNRMIDNTHFQRNESKIEPRNNYRNDHRVNRNNNVYRNGNFSRQDSRNGLKHANYNGNNIHNEKPLVRNESVPQIVTIPDVNESPEVRTPDLLSATPKIKNQKAYRKSSSPFMLSLNNLESESETRIVESTDSLIIDVKSIDLNDNIDKKPNVVMVDECIEQINIDMKDEKEINVLEIDQDLQESKELYVIPIYENESQKRVEHTHEDLIEMENRDDELQFLSNTEKCEDIVECCNDTVNESIVENDTNNKFETSNQLKTVTQEENFSEDNKIDSVLTGRLTYYREDLLALHNSQTIPCNLLNDPSLAEVISTKIQILNFLKKEIFVKPQTTKSDYLDFTRRNHNIQPKRLIRSENGYLPPQLRQASDDKMKNLKRNIKSILNKMTPENFEICTSEIVHLDIDDEENMKCLIDEIFYKAIQEESYSSTYVKFCAHMCAVRVGKDTFKTLLLRKCQNMFEKPLHLQLEDVKLLWEEKAANEKDQRIKKLYESDIDEQVKKAKDKYFGNIRFFSELFLANQLAGNIIICCANQLLKYDKDNNSLEAVCKLLQICGAKLEQKQIATKDKRFSDIMSQVVLLSQRNDIEPRLRFKLKDIVDMQGRGWELRGIQKAITSVPKTLDEIKDERIKTEIENAKTNYNQSNTNIRQRSSVQRSVMDTKRFQLETQNLTKETVLGPQIRTQWGSGCKSNNATTNINGWNAVQSYRKPVISSQPLVLEKTTKIQLQNKYAQLSEETETEVKQEVTSSMETRVTSDIVNNDETISTELFDLIMKRMSPVNRWKELMLPVAIIDKWFYLMFDRKEDCRILLGDYFHDLLNIGSLTYEQLLEGSVSTMGSVDDIIDDVPNFWIYLAQFLERFIKSESSDLTFLNIFFKDIGYENNVDKCKQLIKKSASERLGSTIVEDLFMKYMQ